MAKVKKKVLPVLYSIKHRLSMSKLWLEAWFDPFGDDHAIPGIWQRERIVFPWKSVEGQGDRHLSVGGQQVEKLQENVQALHDMGNSGSEGGSIF